MTRTFTLADILSITSGYVLATDNTGGLNAVLDLFHHMTGERPYHEGQLDRFAAECRPYLYEWFPELRQVADHLPRFADALEKAKKKGKDNAEGLVDGFILGLLNGTDCKPEYQVPRIYDYVKIHGFKD